MTSVATGGHTRVIKRRARERHRVEMASIAVLSGCRHRMRGCFCQCTGTGERTTVAGVAAQRGDVRVIECGRDRERIRWNAMAEYTLRRSRNG